MVVCVHRVTSRERASRVKSLLFSSGYSNLFDKTVSVWIFRGGLSIRDAHEISGFNYSRLAIFVDEVGQAGEIHVLMVP